MHPQIRRPQPGNCPICGMALEPVLPTLDEGPSPELVDSRRFVDAADRHRPRGDGRHRQQWLAPDAELGNSLSAPVVWWAAWPFFVRWRQSLASRSLNM
jgi:Cu+-exporting ATPase